MSKTIVVLEGDQTGQELLEEALRVLDPSVTGVEVDLQRFDLSLEQRRATKNDVVRETADAMLAAGLGLKAATITPEIKGDIGSPNAILRERVDGTVIVRTGRRIPGVRPVGGVHAPISVIRMAVGDAYGAKEWREGDGLDEVAFRTERITRRHCRAVAEYAFLHAEKMGAKVFGSIAGSESLLLSFTDDWRPRVVMAEAPHGTAPSLFGKNLANPMAMILAAGSLLSYIGEPKATLAARAISESVFEAVYDGVRTADLQGHAMTTEFTDEVIKRVKTKLAVWPSLSA